MRSAKVDRNQPEVVAALRKAGASVQVLSPVGQGCPDLLVGYGGHNFLYEVKDGALPPSRTKLTPDQVEWHQGWKGQVLVVYSVEMALKALEVLP